MFKRPILTLFFAWFAFVSTMLVGILTNESVQVSVFNKQLEWLSGNMYVAEMRINPEGFDMLEGYELSDNAFVGKYGTWSFCQYDLPETTEYDVDLITVEVDERIESGQIFMVDMLFENTGNTRLFAGDSECYDMPELNVGTQNATDRASVFGSEEFAISGWDGANRIKMVNEFADPGEEFHVIFQSIAPEHGDHAGDIYREFFQPVIEGEGWVDEMFAYDIEIGTPSQEMKDDIFFVSDLAVPASLLSGKERNLEINLAEQRLYAQFGDLKVWSMETSTGAYDTPTPRGNYKILNKQELRIGGAAPHYRMPFWQGWRTDGYGIHGLPYLGANDGGWFWKEAENHIGIPVSHGCIRTPDRDAETLHGFTVIGTPMFIY
ncbi:L,D-transpeptidase [Candidatus Peregrinibacteria bacterium]|jgi:hypothetical protein|nr:L,D-transpeptidase [Candidatus Peregrinibacteria bacterium]